MNPPNFKKLENYEKLENIMCFSNNFCYATKFNNQASIMFVYNRLILCLIAIYCYRQPKERPC